jgi:hypothetical protein
MKHLTRMKLVWALLMTGIMLLVFGPMAIADPQRPWVLPARNLSAAGQNSDQPQIAVGPNGAATAVWRNFDGSGGGSKIQTATRPPGGSFGTPVALSVAGQNTWSPQIAIGPNGATTVVWYRSNGYVGIIQAATRPPGGSFGAPVNLSAAGQFASDPQIAFAPDGAATVVWSTYVNGFTDAVQAATRPPGGSFGAPVNLSAVGESASSPQIAIAPDGAATAVWFFFKGTASRIQVATRQPGGSFSAPVNLGATGESEPYPQIAVGPNGAATVVWSAYLGGSSTLIRSATRPPGGSFTPPVSLSAPGRNAFSPQVAIAADGTATAVWQGFNGTNRLVRAATRPPGGNFGAAVDLSAFGQNATSPQIEFARDGTSTVVWQRTDGRNWRVQAATRPPGGLFGAAVDLSAPGRNAYGPQVSVAPNGTATAIWHRNNDTKSIIQSASTAQPSRIGKLELRGPARVKRGRVAVYRVAITNSGRTRATGVRLKVSGRGAGFNTPVGRIAVGTTRTVNVRLRPRRTGRVVVTFRVTSFNAGGRAVRKAIRVGR